MPNDSKLTIKGLFIALAFGLASLVVMPFYVTPLGFVWVPFMAFIYVRYGKIPAYSASVFLFAAGYVYAGLFAALLAGITAMAAVAALSMALRADAKLNSAGLTVMFALLFCVIGAIAVFQALYGDLVLAVIGLFRRTFDLVPELKAAYEQTFAQLYGAGYTLESLFYDLEGSMRTMLPASVLDYCLYGAAFGVLAGVRTAARTGQTQLYGTYDRFYNWVLPKYAGRSLAAAALVVYLISATAVPTLFSVANTLWRLFYALYVLQGMAAMAFTFKIRGKSKAMRTTVILLLFVLFKPALFAAGLFDRISPMRKLLRVGTPDSPAAGGENGANDNGENKDKE